MKGNGTDIRYALTDSPIDRMLVAATARGVCAVFFGDDDAELAQELHNDFPEAALTRDDAGLSARVAQVSACFGPAPDAPGAVPLDVPNGGFHAAAWLALQTIPRGETRTYGQIAAELGRPGGAISVGQACARNPVSLVIPCHRVLRTGGGLGGYRWGLERKQRLLALERGAD